MSLMWYPSTPVVALAKSRFQHRYLREPQPLVFPVCEPMPETRRHLEVRTALYQSLKAAFRDVAVLGSEQFVYWDPTDPKACCAPDVMVRLGERDAPFDSWKVWERGAPHLAVEIISDSDSSETAWSEKLERYRKVGLRELVRFDADAKERPLRIWDFQEGDLVERDSNAAEFSFSSVLGAYFCVRPEPEVGLTLRLARDAQGAELFLTHEEAQKAAEQREKVAEQRIRELEAELARRGG